jgi:hypothetical protein
LKVGGAPMVAAYANGAIIEITGADAMALIRLLLLVL